MTIERLGIYQGWQRSFKNRAKNCEKDAERLLTYSVRELEAYADDGIGVTHTFGDDLNPPLASWEKASIESALATRAYGYTAFSEATLLKQTQKQPTPETMYAFSCKYYALLMWANREYLAPLRFAAEPSFRVFMIEIPYIALGYLLGDTLKAKQLLRLFLWAFYRDRELHPEYPIYSFMLRLMADFEGEPPITLSGKAQQEVLFHALFEAWRSPNPEDIKELCLAACDYHTHRCRGDTKNGKEWYEFSWGHWYRWPIEILLLFKLREKLGLANPTLDHPLMNSALGQLPPEQAFACDPLVTRVVARMKSHGFDEQEVYEKVYFGR